ncbi:MAG: YebC/PmpR family DNA-binding transcriptional regulator [Gemmataceae bacterium]|nr:YebC/PmpR family DNA-binding transcriptional regulator [Gemmataceae bacterium]
MAGHSHFANIAVHKAKVDAKRGKLWSKLSRYIIVAARNGGGDPVTNLKLRYAIDKAREVSMPKDNIERAIKRGTGELAGDVMEELTYEGFGPGGCAVLVDVLTDNRNRTSGEVRKILERAGGKLGSAGNVAFLFDRKGQFLVPAGEHDEDTLMSIALDAGAEDVRAVEGGFEVFCDPTEFTLVKEGLEKAGVKTAESHVAQVPKMPKEVDLETGRKIVRMVDALDDHDDVQQVFTDADLTTEMMEG